MQYFTISLVLLTILCIIYISIFISKRDDKNILEDVPNISVNKDDLEKHAAEISSYYADSNKTNSRRKLMHSLKISYKKIRDGFVYIDNEVKEKHEIVPAAEWLLDNLYLIEKEYKDIRFNMPREYYKDLPLVNKGLMKGYPRIYNIAVEIVSHTDGRIDEKAVITFIKGFQKNTILTSGEIWALPIMLRIALIQNISKITESIIFAQEEKKKGDVLAEKITRCTNEADIIKELKKIPEVKLVFTSHFTERLLRTLRNNEVDCVEIYTWIEEKLLEQGSSIEKIISLEHQKQASFELSLGNCITGIREAEAINWRDVFSEVSYLDSILSTDPSNIYNLMDFESKDYYRHKIEKLGKKYNLSESYIGKKAIECAKECINDLEKPYLHHVGYYLMDEGEHYLVSKLKDSSNRSISFIEKHKVSIYILFIIISTILFDLFITLSEINKHNGIYIIAFILGLIPISEIVICIFNWSITSIVKPSFIPKIEFKDGIPKEQSTIIIIPTIINNVKRLHEMIEEMEVYYLGNQEKNLYLALLSDFKDSTMEKEKEDEDIIKTALAEIKALNKRYAKKDHEIFFFFSRYRQFNEKENKWLGYERKRGKIMEFLSLLKGDKNTSYNIISAFHEDFSKAKYIITLDADTKLPRDSAKKLIGAMAHPLNNPYLDKDGRIIRGYGIMQPRISVSNLSANKTLFSRIFSGETGIDLYTTAVSDTYEDLFKEGIFTGKGIFHIDVFYNSLKNEIPENTVLSHDLLEGSFARCALVTDIEFIDGYPAYYISSSKRSHRWVRGDWQLIPFLKNKKLNLLSKWKIIDNMRRSLLYPSVLLLSIYALAVLPLYKNYVIASVLSIICPILFNVSEAVMSPIRGSNVNFKIKSGRMRIEQIFLTFCFIPFQAYLMTDAIIRTLYRITISKKKLLEWQTAADAEATSKNTFFAYLKTMWFSVFTSLLLLFISYFRGIEVLYLIAPTSVIFFLSPFIAYYISKDLKQEMGLILGEDGELLRRLSRKTYAYFEDFINKDTNFLPPDNYQEDPPNGIAYRTSPTNMGMGLMSYIVALDMGYIGIGDAVDKIDIVLSSMEGLKRIKGHFYNWYDLKSLEPLYPEYISTVDSGNLAGYLWVVAKALEDSLNKSILSYENFKGIRDTMKLAEEEAKKITGEGLYEDILAQISHENADLIAWKKLLLNTWSKVMHLENSEKYSNEIYYWNSKLRYDIGRYLQEIEKFFPFAEFIVENPDFCKSLPCDINTLCFSTSATNCYKEVYKVQGKLKDKLNNIEKDYIKDFKNSISSSLEEFQKLFKKIDNLVVRLNNLVTAMDFKALYSKKRGLFSIGYDVHKDAVNNCYYDLLASESRQASFIAIAKGDVEQKHWFKLGRAMTIMNKSSKGLVSWTGTMFEYLMPLLIMKNYPDTLLDETYRSVILEQKNYGKIKRVPFGISESAFYDFDINKNYQYKAFGVPSIGLKRGLSKELVVSPYSTMLALQVDLKASFNNIKKLITEGLEGRYGLYEAIDYTKDRLPKKDKKAIVKCFMVHHLGMSFMSLDNVLNCNILRERFHSVPVVKATELLLQEKVPKKVIYDREQNFEMSEQNYEKQNIIVRTYETWETPTPETSIMSNGSYSLMIDNRGCGYGKKEDINLYRWNGDATTTALGMFFYIKNVNSLECWSASYEPCKSSGDYYEVIFSLDKAEFRRKDGNISSNMEITVSNEDDTEIRRLTITNHSTSTRIIEITSYLEATLAKESQDIVHPAFSNLFVKTKYIDSPFCIIASRRPRSSEEKKKYMMQTVTVEGESIGSPQYETSRANFIGRGRNVTNPLAMEADAPLSNTAGAVLDPIISIRTRVKINPGKSCKVSFATSCTEAYEEAINLAKKYSDALNITRAFELSWTAAQVEIKYLGIKSAEANLYQIMASRLLYLNPLMRQREKYIKGINKCQSSLWCYGISGDLPIGLLVVSKNEDLDIIRRMLFAHKYISLKKLQFDLVIINKMDASYMQPLNDSIRDLINLSHTREEQNKRGKVFLLGKDVLKDEDIDFFMAIASFVIDTDNGILSNQLKISEDIKAIDNFEIKGEEKFNIINTSYDKSKLIYFNGFGGFTTSLDEYVICLKDYLETPAPWINVISNGNFGFNISESGSSYTWSKNSRENKLTPWSNDAISDPMSEALYLRDEISGKIFSITPKPIRDSGEYIIKHGFGYSTFMHEAQGILGEIISFVPLDKKHKMLIVKLKNETNKNRKISLTYFAELNMGVCKKLSSRYISTYINKEKEYMYARNPYNNPFKEDRVYLKIYGGSHNSFTGDRAEFLGVGGSMSSPKALKKEALSFDCGSGFDPCLCQQTKIDILPLEHKELVILLGEEESEEKIENIIAMYNEKVNFNNELDKVKEYWKKILGKLQVKTPDESFNILLNGWLLYQVIACRFNSRTAFYQSGGAYGFRDQLQDSMAISYSQPQITRDHILYSASKQYLEGDVQHWWHPYIGSGIRTRFSDDLLWLPYVTSDYIKNTGDINILKEEILYLTDEPLKEGEDERYGVSRESDYKENLYCHCIKSIDRALKFGPHNLPLMGSGDWNDGMNTVGNKGSGESVWLGFFLICILKEFIGICKAMGEEQKALEYEKYKDFLVENIEKSSWDGSWYKRAYFDDGTPLGSIVNEECQIDSLSQSFAVICGEMKESRTEEAMRSLEKYLIKEDKGIVLLLTPPFNKSSLKPGYIKGYVPGVRENGGQYTHAAVWVMLAYTKLKDGNKAIKLFNMLNPINHAKSSLECNRYKVEPYVMAADVYERPPHEGRGGWSWYTGAAGWMYKTSIGSILGFKFAEGKGFTLEPCIPEEWPGFTLVYKEGKATYNIEVMREKNSEKNKDEISTIFVDDVKTADNIVPFMEEGEHKVLVII